MKVIEIPAQITDGRKVLASRIMKTPQHPEGIEFITVPSPVTSHDISFMGQLLHEVRVAFTPNLPESESSQE